MTRVCFVCLGNICRSPMAEGVFRHMAEQAGLATRIHIESAGMGPWHVGEPADPRARKAALAHGIALIGTAQQLSARDFDRFDLLLALDQDVAASLHRLARTPEDRKKIRLLREFDPEAKGDLNVPDPYYGGPEGFEDVYRMVERACVGLINAIAHGP